MTHDQLEAARAQRQGHNEKALEAALKTYILDAHSPRYKEYRFGGLLNLISTIRKIAEELHEDEDSNSGITADDVAAIAACEDALDVVTFA